MSMYHRASGVILGARTATYRDIGHKVGTSIILWAYSRGRILAKTVKVVKDDSPFARAPVGPIHEDLPWSMSGVGAKGRIDPSTELGSVIFESTNSRLQRKISDALVERYPGVRWTVFGEGPSMPLQKYYETLA